MNQYTFNWRENYIEKIQKRKTKNRAREVNPNNQKLKTLQIIDESIIERKLKKAF